MLDLKNEPHNSATSFAFSSKADVLENLSRYPELHIPPCYSFTSQNWANDSKAILDRIKELFPHKLLAVRSSCRKEDAEDLSCAGAFLSLLKIPADDQKALEDAINKVFSSYGEVAQNDQVLVQPMIENPAVTGVIMTRALADGSPYYTINYDDESGRTDSITGGTASSKTVHVFRAVRDQDFDSPRIRSFIALARHLEEICASDALDIEFCLDRENILHLLQVRPICSRHNWPEESGEVDGFIDHIAKFIDQRTGPEEGIFGQRSILGVMPDWNPAEMIGILPRPLASSLYRYLITSNVWSSARKRMGYRDIPASELMLLVMGRPYIDVRASFNSFLPAGLDNITCEALVSAWLERLENNPQLHDKVEFEIAQTTLDFCFEQNMDQRYPGLLPQSRRNNFREALCKLTQKCLDLSSDGTMHQSLEAIAELRLRQSARPLPQNGSPPPLAKVNELIEECRRLGTLPFSILARHAFIAESLLRTAVSRGVIDAQRVKDFKFSIRTISGELSDEFLEVCKGQRDPKNFLRKYGHLRPGSYDILSPRYADREKLFSMAGAGGKTHNGFFALKEEENKALAALLAENNLSISPAHLLEYARKAIEGRELAKFIFSRNLSDALEIMAMWGESQGFTRDDVSFMDLSAILDQKVAVLPENPRDCFARHVEINKKMFEKARALKLGYLIRSERDVFIAPQHRAAPNFIGIKEAIAQPLILNANSSCDTAMEGKIICIENADPGFDWIFTRNIAGLVTKFGGTNSHMAIRCAEYALPAAIGAGEKLFEKIASADRVELNPRAETLKTV